VSAKPPRFYYKGSRLKQLRAFCAAARLGSVTRAAEALFLSQPAVSLQLGALESELSVKLFERQGRRLNLTHEGEELYELARRGVEVQRQPRKIHIYSIRLLLLQGKRMMFDVSCSRGTYVRTLCREIAEALGTAGHMSFLVRTAVGPFLLQETLSLEEAAQLAGKKQLSSALLAVDFGLQHLSRALLTDREAERLQHGGFIPYGEKLPAGRDIRVYRQDGRFLALAEVRDGLLRPKKVFHHR